MSSPARHLPHFPLLDGLRGVAILLVVFYHNFGFTNYFFFGWLGVDLFFVLSGFLITSLLQQSVGRPGYLKNFFGRRALRIFPLYYLTLFFFFVLVPRSGLALPELSYYSRHQAWLWLYLQNWLYIFEQPSTYLLSHLWSLAVEEQFYLLWPFALLAVRNTRLLFYGMLALLLAVVAGRFLVWTYHIEQLAYFNLYTFSRIDGICIGSMLALLRSFDPSFLKRQTTLLVFLFAGLNFLFYFFNRAYGFSFPYLAIVGYTTFAFLWGLLVNEALDNRSPLLHRVLGNRLLRFFGTISYGLYIFHWPLYVLFRRSLQQWSEDRWPALPGPLVASLLTTLLAIGLAWFSYRFFETPFLRLKRHFAPA